MVSIRTSSLLTASALHTLGPVRIRLLRPQVLHAEGAVGTSTFLPPGLLYPRSCQDWLPHFMGPPHSMRLVRTSSLSLVLSDPGTSTPSCQYQPYTPRVVSESIPSHHRSCQDWLLHTPDSIANGPSHYGSCQDWFHQTTGCQNQVPHTTTGLSQQAPHTLDPVRNNVSWHVF